MKYNMAHTVTINKQEEKVDKHEEFDKAMDEYTELNFYTPENKKTDEYRADGLFIIRTLILQGHIDLVQDALDEEELGPEMSSRIKQLIATLKDGYPQ
jgi:hypothetical protein